MFNGLLASLSPVPREFRRYPTEFLTKQTREKDHCNETPDNTVRFHWLRASRCLRVRALHRFREAHE